MNIENLINRIERHLTWLIAVSGFAASVSGPFGQYGAFASAVLWGTAIAFSLWASISNTRRMSLTKRMVEQALIDIAKNRPAVSTAAAFQGQGDLATLNYNQLKAKLEGDYAVLAA